ncbi:hypothetical protein TruAng_009899 [Truncatella angustata]|nr:hypothetical protein TruAng_009899 [Truncatella angustata]
MALSFVPPSRNQSHTRHSSTFIHQTRHYIPQIDSSIRMERLWPNRLSRALSGSGRKSPKPEGSTEQSTKPPVSHNPFRGSSATRQPRERSPPPAYTPTVAGPSGQSLGASSSSSCHQKRAHPAISRAEASTEEDKYAFLSKFDTVFLIDDSYSMTGDSWRETKQALASMLPVIFSHDQDGPDFYFMNHKTEDLGSSSEPWKAGTGYRNVTRAEGNRIRNEQLTVEEIFKKVRPNGTTPTGQRLGDILRTYVRNYEAMIRKTQDETCLKPLNIIVITDGVPDDAPGAIIQQFAKKLDTLDAPPYQIGIQFFQVGNAPGAAEALRTLDDKLNKDKNPDEKAEGAGRQGLVPSIRDIVDTSTFDDRTGDAVLTADLILKVLLGAVNPRLDALDSNLRE